MCLSWRDNDDVSRDDKSLLLVKQCKGEYMGLFGPTKTEEEKIQEILVKYGLDIDHYDTKSIKKGKCK